MTLVYKEQKLGLWRVKFQKYRAAIKKYGHQGDLYPQHMKAISDLINLNVDHLLSKEDSYEA
jgi:hypothetical protein